MKAFFYIIIFWLLFDIGWGHFPLPPPSAPAPAYYHPTVEK